MIIQKDIVNIHQTIIVDYYASCDYMTTHLYPVLDLFQVTASLDEAFTLLKRTGLKFSSLRKTSGRSSIPLLVRCLVCSL